MALRGDDPCDPERAQRLGRIVDAFHLKADAGQRFRYGRRIGFSLQMILQP